MPDPVLDALLDRARSGDEAAFAGVYRDVQPRLLRYLAVRSADRAEDLCSETWLEVARGLAAFEGDGTSFLSWVFTIARHKLVDGVRRDARRPERLVEATDELDAMAGAAAGGPDPAELTEAEEATRRAVALVRTLPPDQAEALMLRVVAEMDYVEIALLMGRSQGAVRVLAHRGLRRLARTLGVSRPGELAESVEGGVTG